jgi:hypothetical protein
LRALKNLAFGLNLGAPMPLVFTRLLDEEALLFALHFDQGLFFFGHPSQPLGAVRAAHTPCRRFTDLKGVALTLGVCVSGIQCGPGHGLQHKCYADSQHTDISL